MFKFLRGQKKQQNTENAGIPDPAKTGINPDY